MWDKRGWFWNPVDTIHTDFVEADPRHYESLGDLIPDIPPLTIALPDDPANTAMSKRR